MGESQASIAARLEGSSCAVLQIATLDAVASIPVLRRFAHAEPLAAALLGAVPLGACALETLLGERAGWFVWSTAAIYGALISFMLFAARRYWPTFAALGADMDAILDGEGRERVLHRLDRALSLGPQVLFMACGLAFSTTVAIELTEPIGTHYIEAGALAYVLTIGWTGAVGAITAYWLWGAPAMFYPLAKTKSPRLDWLAPAQTPAVQKSTRLMIASARLAAFGLLLFTIPIALTLALASGNWAVWVLSVSPLVLSIASILGCSVIPMRALEALIRAGKADTLATIRPYLPSPSEAFNAPSPDLLASLALYERIADASVSLIDWRRLSESTLLLLSAIVPILIALFSR